MRLLTIKSKVATKVTSKCLVLKECLAFRRLNANDFTFAHRKHDGQRVVYAHMLDGCRLLTTSGLDILPEVNNPKGWPELPIGSFVEGELCAESGSRSDVKSCIANGSPVSFYGFATDLLPKSADLTTVNRRLWQLGFDICDLVPNTQHLHSEPDYRQWEGFILKNTNYGMWMKFKWERTIDLIVTGFVKGKGKYAGQVGSLRCSTTEGVEVARVGGMTDSIRDGLEQCLGRVCEVKYQLVGSAGRLTHPRFIKWRDDKKASECTMSQDEDLLKFL